MHSKNNGNVFLYYWTYPSSVPNYGACHAVELAYIFNNFTESSFIGDKNINYKLAEISQNMWTNFAKDGNPSTEDYNWKKYDTKNNYSMVLGKEPELKENLFSGERNEIVESLLYQYIPTDYESMSFNVPFVRRILFIIIAIFIIIISMFINKYFK